MYSRDISGLKQLLTSQQRGPEEVEFCRWIYSEIEQRWPLDGTWLDFKPPKKNWSNPTTSAQYMCRIYGLPEGQKTYGWSIPGFGDKNMAGGVCIDIAGDRLGFKTRIKEFDQQVFWGLKFPRGSEAISDVVRKGIPDRIKSFGGPPAEFIDKRRPEQFGGWYLLGYRVKSIGLSAWDASGIDSLLDAIANGLSRTYELCAAQYS